MSPWRQLLLIQHLPLEAASFQYGFSRTDLLLFDVVHALTGKQHPSDPRPKPDRPSRDRLIDARKRFADRRRQLGITGSVLKPKE